MIKKSEKITGNGKKFQVKIEKLRTKISTYKTLSFTIWYNQTIVYQKTDIKNIYENK